MEFNLKLTTLERIIGIIFSLFILAEESKYVWKAVQCTLFRHPHDSYSYEAYSAKWVSKYSSTLRLFTGAWKVLVNVLNSQSI